MSASTRSCWFLVHRILLGHSPPSSVEPQSSELYHVSVHQIAPCHSPPSSAGLWFTWPWVTLCLACTGSDSLQMSCANDLMQGTSWRKCIVEDKEIMEGNWQGMKNRQYTFLFGLQVYCGAASGCPRGCRCFARIRAVFSPSGCASKDAHLGDSGNSCTADGRPKAETGGWQGSDWQSIKQTWGVRCLKQWACC